MRSSMGAFMICDYCQQDVGSVSIYNPMHKMECSRCLCKRVGIYDHLTKEEVVAKLLIAHREMHCLSETVKSQSEMLEARTMKIDRLKTLLVKWWWYGNGTDCQGLVVGETKEAIGNMVP